MAANPRSISTQQHRGKQRGRWWCGNGRLARSGRAKLGISFAIGRKPTKAKAPPKRGFYRTLVPESNGHACQAITAYDTPNQVSRHKRHGLHSKLRDGWTDSAEDRGIEPLRLQAAVQRLASVPSTHTGSVLRSRAYRVIDCIHVTPKPVVTYRIIFLAWFQFGIGNRTTILAC